jgi:beta-mannosidase
VWTLQDLAPGSGWGVIDAAGEPKPAWYALKRAFRPVQIALTDEGCNGLAIHLHNETAAPVEARLSLRCLREGEIAVVSAERAVNLAPRSSQELSGFELIGGFFDLAYAYRFGLPSHDVTHAVLADSATAEVLAEAFHFPLGRAAAIQPASISAEAVRDGEDWLLELRTDRLAQSVQVQDARFRPEDDGFHLAPGRKRRVRLLRRSGADAGATPAGEVRAFGASAVRYAAAD